jgi:putative SOS response-associated peptidase YedK
LNDAILHAKYRDPIVACRFVRGPPHAMCGRYASFLPPEVLARLLKAVNPLPNLQPTWNMAPTLGAPVVRRHGDERHLDVLKWGLVPSFTKDIDRARKPINARCETVATSGMFRSAFAERRCLVPAPIYYEWRTDADRKVPFAVARTDGNPVVFAGMWESWTSPEGEQLLTFATITTNANRRLSVIQDRMPVILEQNDWPLWLGETAGDARGLLRPAAEDVLTFWPIDPKVGNVRNDGPDLIEPVTQTEPLLL